MPSGKWPSNDTSSDLQERARRLRIRLREVLQVLDRMIHDEGPTHGSRADDRVRRLIRVRRMRDTLLGAQLFSDPAWDILLELYAVELSEQRLHGSALCLRTQNPSSTTMRWINALEARGLVSRKADPLDSRRAFISLTPEAVEAMGTIFKKLPSGPI